MTRVLDLVDHTFMEFVTSVEYDEKHGLPSWGNTTIRWEDSFSYAQGDNLEEWLEQIQPLYLWEIMDDKDIVSPNK